MPAVHPSACFRAARPDIVAETFDDEVVIVDLVTGSYFSVDLIGGRIRDLLLDGHCIATVIESLSETYAADRATIEASVSMFVTELVDAGLLVRAEQTSAPKDVAPVVPTTAEGSRPAFHPPSLVAYSDMQDLLLLDPIHDVDESGWPARPETPPG